MSIDKANDTILAILSDVGCGIINRSIIVNMESVKCKCMYEDIYIYDSLFVKVDIRWTLVNVKYEFVKHEHKCLYDYKVYIFSIFFVYD